MNILSLLSRGNAATAISQVTSNGVRKGFLHICEKIVRQTGKRQEGKDKLHVNPFLQLRVNTMLKDKLSCQRLFVEVSYPPHCQRYARYVKTGNQALRSSFQLSVEKSKPDLPKRPVRAKIKSSSTNANSKWKQVNRGTTRWPSRDLF